jgi:hypothetical protein
MIAGVVDAVGVGRQRRIVIERLAAWIDELSLGPVELVYRNRALGEKCVKSCENRFACSSVVLVPCEAFEPAFELGWV